MSIAGMAERLECLQNRIAQKKYEQSCFSPQAEVDVESQSEEFQRGWKSYGSTSHYYRYGLLKRDCPRIAKAIVDGKYTRERDNGKLYVCMTAAEIDAEKLTKGRYKAPDRRPKGNGC